MTVSIFAKAARITVAVCLPFALAAALSGCATESSGQENAAAPPPPEIVAYAVKQADIPLEMAFMGQTAGSREVEVRARVGGILLRRNYEEGSRVRQGQLMFEIDPARLR